MEEKNNTASASINAMITDQALEHISHKRYKEAFVLVEDALRKITDDYNSHHHQLIILKMRITRLMADDT